MGNEFANSSENSPAPKRDDDFMTEEDRLAFLRAQAAQDAALASLTAPGGAARAGSPARGAPTNGRVAPGPGAPSKWGKNDRGGRGRRDRGRGRVTPPNPANGAPVGAGGRFTGGFRQDRPAEGAPTVETTAAPAKFDAPSSDGSDDTQS